jgi:hypothetical protein
MTSTVLIVLILLVLVAGWRARDRLRRMKHGPSISDDMVRDIETRGTVDVEEPLDYDEIAREEQRFFEETWDEPDEY